MKGMVNLHPLTWNDIAGVLATFIVIKHRVEYLYHIVYMYLKFRYM